MLLLALAVVSALASSAYNSGRNSLTAAVIQELSSIAAEKEAALHAWINIKQHQIGEISQLRAIQDSSALLFSSSENDVASSLSPEILLQNLQPFVSDGGPFLGFLLMDPTTGRVMLATNQREEGKYKEIFDYFLEGREGPYISPPYYSPELLELAITASSPLYDRQGNLLAVLAGRLPVHEMDAIVGLSSGQRESLDSFLVSKANLFLTQPQFIENPAVLRRGIHTEQVQRCLRKENGWIESTDYRGERVIAIYRWLPAMESCLIVKLDYEEAVAPQREFGATILIFGLIALLGASMLALTLAGTITRPILALERSATRFAQGETNVYLPEDGDDELAQLTRTFNAMATALSAERTALRRRIEQIYTLAPSLIATADLDGYFVDLNPSWERILGYTDDELKAQPFLTFVHPDDQEATIAEAAMLGEGGMVANFENRYRTAGGEYRWLSWTAVGSPEDRMIYSVAVDITEQREAEKKLRESEAEMRAILASMNDVILVLDANAGYLKVAPTGTKLFMQSPEQLKGKRMHDIFGEEQGEEFVTVIRNVLETGKPVNIDYQLDYPDGRTIWFSAVLNRMNHEAVVWVARDVTARKQSEEALAEQAEELARSNRELEQFAYVASHDLQEPLRTVTSAVQLLSRRYRGKLDSNADEFIDFATDAAERMKQLINDLLLYSRAGTRGKPFKPTSMPDVLEQTLVNLRFLIEDADAQITWDALPTVNGDAGQLVQLFQNLIANGIKFHREERPTVHISAEAYTGEIEERNGIGPMWHFRVQDNGLGIEETYLDRIFIIFQRLNSSVDYPGTGIGLALCKKIVERHRGRIWVESTMGQGSIFHFTLPAHTPEYTNNGVLNDTLENIDANDSEAKAADSAGEQASIGQM